MSLKNEIKPRYQWLLKLPSWFQPVWLKKKIAKYEAKQEQEDDVAKQKPLLDIAIWHQDRLDAAYVMHDYAKKIFEDAWGDDYDVQVSIREESLPGDADALRMFGDENSTTGDVPAILMGAVNDGKLDGKAKDVNLLLFRNCKNRGGGSACRASTENADWRSHQNPDIGDVRGESVRKYAFGKPYGLISSGLHEMLHCVGFGHNVGGTRRYKGIDYVTLMPYMDGENYYLRVSDEGKQKKPDVVSPDGE